MVHRPLRLSDDDVRGEVKVRVSQSVVGAARRILDADVRSTFEDIDVDHVRRLASGDPPIERPILFRRGNESPSIADGNHYATARAIRLLEAEEYVPQAAYLGVRRYPSVR